MDRTELIKIAEQTLQITTRGNYTKGSRKVKLPTRDSSGFNKAILFDPSKVQALMEKAENLSGCCCGDKKSIIYLLDADSLEAAEGLKNPLVMNFANAIHPGGGFLSGAKAQEESLCRCSTLYASLSSANANEMYRYNKEHLNSLDSDYMLLSPNVCVFRDAKGNLLDQPYQVAVLTIPAPNKNGRAASVPQEEIDRVMMDRLRQFFLVAAHEDYHTLVLGAWGCGAFGHDAKTVASYFYRILIDEGYEAYFDTILFSVYRGGYNLEAFREVFEEKIEDCTSVKTLKEKDDGFLTFKSEFPVCNHIQEVDSDNIGYVQGLFLDGTPFEAELWTNENERSLTVVMPEDTDFTHDIARGRNTLRDGNTLGFHNEVQTFDHSVLTVGMVDRGTEDDLSVTMKYVQKLTDAGLVFFTGLMENGAVFYMTDVTGSDLVRINIALEIDGNTVAKTPLRFRSFPTNPKPRECKVIKLDLK